MQTFNLFEILSKTDAVGLAVAAFLLLMSIASWWLIVMGAMRLRSLRAERSAAGRFWDGESPEACLGSLGAGSGSWREVAEAGAEAGRAYDERGNAGSLAEKADWVERGSASAIERISQRISRGLPALSSIGATAPFVGLFGTVWGIYHTLMSLSSGGQMTIDQVAGPIGESLVMTGFGLFVAIPAVLGNNAIAAGNRAVLEDLASFAGRLATYLATGKKPGSARSE